MSARNVRLYWAIGVLVILAGVVLLRQVGPDWLGARKANPENHGPGACYYDSDPGESKCMNNVTLKECGSSNEFQAPDAFISGPRAVVEEVRDSLHAGGETCDAQSTRYVAAHSQRISAQEPGIDAFTKCTEGELKQKIAEACPQGFKGYLVEPKLLAERGWFAKRALEELGIEVPKSQEPEDLYRAKCAAVVVCEGQPQFDLEVKDAAMRQPQININVPDDQQVINLNNNNNCDFLGNCGVGNGLLSTEDENVTFDVGLGLGDEEIRSEPATILTPPEVTPVVTVEPAPMCPSYPKGFWGAFCARVAPLATSAPDVI